MRSGELARQTGISTDTLRHYERIGVLPRPLRTQGGYRLYPADSVDRVRLIRHALRVGFTLAELAKILRVRDTGGAPCRQVRALAAEKLQQVDQRLRELKLLRKHLQNTLASWDERLSATPDGQRAGLLDMLVTQRTES